MQTIQRVLLVSGPPFGEEKKANEHHGFIEAYECWRNIQAPIADKHVLEIHQHIVNACITEHHQRQHDLNKRKQH